MGQPFYVYSCAAEAAAPSLHRPSKRARTVMEAAHAHIDSGMAVRNEAGIRFVNWLCADAGRVGRFYEDIFGCVVWRAADGMRAAVCVGPSVHLVFSNAPAARGVEAAQRARGVHVCVYICEFQRAHDRLRERGLIWTNPRFAHLDSCGTFEEAAAGRQFRFRLLKDDCTDEELAELEHEVRSLRHLQFMKRALRRQVRGCPRAVPDRRSREAVPGCSHSPPALFFSRVSRFLLIRPRVSQDPSCWATNASACSRACYRT